MDQLLPKKAHRASKSGAKATKKTDRKNKKLTAQGKMNGKKENPRAFGVANIVRTKRTQQRNLDRMQKKELVPLVDRTDEVK